MRGLAAVSLLLCAAITVSVPGEASYAQLESQHYIPLFANLYEAGTRSETMISVVNHLEEPLRVAYDTHSPIHNTLHTEVGIVQPRSLVYFGAHDHGPPFDDYSAVVTADGPFSSTSTRWSYGESKAIVAFGEALPDHDLVVPVAVRRYYGGSSTLVIQNASIGSSPDATVEVELGRNDGTGGVHRQSFTVAPAKAVSVELDSSEFDALGEGFLGSARLRSSQKIAAYALVQMAGPITATYGFEALPAELADETVFVPLFRAEQRLRAGDVASSRVDTGIAVYNPGSESVRASIEYHGANHPAANPSCRGLIFESDERDILPSRALVFYQGDPAAENLPPGCFGSAVIRATGPVVAVANEAVDGGAKAAAFSLSGAHRGALEVAFSYANRSAIGATTGVAVQNVSDTEATVTVTYIPNGEASPVACGAPCRIHVSPNESGFFWPPAQPDVPSGFGDAWLESTEPVIAIVNQVFERGSEDMATHSGNVRR